MSRNCGIKCTDANDVVHQKYIEAITPEQLLANAIVKQAALDYINILLGHHITKTSKESLESFFRSDWYQTLTRLDGEYLMRKCKKKAEELQAKGVRSFRFYTRFRGKYNSCNEEDEII